jgi:hypothetical protein
MKVLVACEESQAVCIAFRERGHEAYSCDLQECSGGHPEWHIKGFAEDAIYQENWDLIIAHPPCTRLANSGVRWLNERDLWHELHDACFLFIKFQSMAGAGYKVCIENPIPHKYAIEYIGKYTQIIQPWQFGHPEQKATCLWLYGLPKLIPTNIVSGREQKVWRMTPGPERTKLRSKTFPGIARAMAEQWG